jgi:inorganic triphosphatase YgiF
MDAAVRKPDALQLTPDLTVGDGLQEMLAGALGAVQGQGTPAKAPNRESVHRLRVGVRRLRSILSAFGDALPDGERRALGDQLRAVAQRFGRARSSALPTRRGARHCRRATASRPVSPPSTRR